MKRRFLVLALCTGLSAFCHGCRTTQATSNPPSQQASETASAPQRVPPQAVASAPVKSPIMIAEKEYLAAYDNYVKMLRESGPQTMETLQALADYQKKYQIYQMLLNAPNGN